MDKEEEKRLKFIFNMYSGGETIDAADCISCMYGMQLAPTRKLMLEVVGTDQRKTKYLTYKDFVEVYKRLKSNTDQGGFHDFVECLKTFDFKENGTMKLNELTYLLKNLGETLDEKELDLVFQDCMLEEEDDDGNVPYMPFICRLCDEPIPKPRGKKKEKAT